MVARSRAGSSAAAFNDIKAPGLDELTALAEEAFQRLPAAFREACGDVVIKVEDFPTEEILNDMGCQTPFDLLGLYQGVSLAEKSVLDAGGLPDMVFLYRRAMLDYWAEHDETLGAIVTHVLVHELGHHLGLSDEDMHAIEDAAG